MPPPPGKIRKLTDYFQKSNLDCSPVISHSEASNISSTQVTNCSPVISQPEASNISSTQATSALPVAYNRLDIGNYIATRLTIPDSLKVELLQKPWIPPLQYEFPRYSRKVQKKDRFSSFQRDWLKEFNWLVYSAVKQGGFCKFCVIFAPKSVAGSDLGLHVQVALSGAQYCAVGRRVLREHASKQYHLAAAVKSDSFLKTLSTGTVVDNLSSASQRLLNSKKNYLEGFASVIHLLGRQNIAFRGHRDSGPLSLDSKRQ
ncbi:uncharacterized protein LOC144745272 [Ciona intestinalis]